MDWKQFIVGVVSSAAWPCVAVIFLLVFRYELTKVAQRLAHLKYKDLEIDFDKIQQQAEELHKEVREERSASSNPVLLSLEDQVLDAIEHAPSAAILLAWSGLEAALASAVARLAISPESPSYRSPAHNIEMLARYAGLPARYVTLLNELRSLRNQVAHHQGSLVSITEDQALHYAQVAMDMLKHLEGLKRRG